MSHDKTIHRRLAAIMFSDICGYSLIMGRDEAQAMRILARHDEIMNGAIAEFGGAVIKRMGDGILAEFHSAVSAVECAMVIQRRIAEQNAVAAEPNRFQVRIGVHLGDVVVSGGDILGDGVNVASRIEPLARPGGICISQDVYNQVHNKVEMEIVSLGPQQLKNIQRQVEIYRVILAAADKEEAAADVAQSAPAPKTARRWLAPAAAVGVVLIALVVAGALYSRAKERRQVANAIRQADDLLRQNEGAKARALIEATLRQSHANTPGRSDLQARLSNAKEMELTEALRQRFDAWITALFQRNFDAAAAFADPDSKMRLGLKNISNRMGMLGFVAGVLRVKTNDFRIREIHLSPDQTTATVLPELRINNAWTDQKATHWKRVDNEWWLVIE